MENDMGKIVVLEPFYMVVAGTFTRPQMILVVTLAPVLGLTVQRCACRHWLLLGNYRGPFYGRGAEGSCERPSIGA